MPSHWKEELFLCLWIIGTTSAAGALVGWPLQGLLLGLITYLSWHAWHIRQLSYWLKTDAQHTPATVGLWKGVVAEIQQLRGVRLSRENNLTVSLSSFRAAVIALPDAVVMFDQNEIIEWCNPAAERLLGISNIGAVGQPLLQKINEPMLAEYLASKDFGRPLIFSAPETKTSTLSLQVAGLASPQRQMLVISDITDQHNLNEAKRDFVANVSHELRTPLTVIIGLLEQSALGELDANTQRRITTMMQQQATRMCNLVSDLLTLARLEAKDAALRDQFVAMPELLADIVEEARTLSAGTGHVLQLHVHSTLGLRGNPIELRAALTNLITNAIKHTPDHSEVDIRWQVDSDGAHLEVHDNGGGIPARHIPRLTERLYRVDASRSRDTGGTGLGLAIVKHALDQHDAELEIASTEGSGTTFSCHFPPHRVSEATEGEEPEGVRSL